MSIVAGVMTKVFDILFLPFGWSALAGITVLSVLAGILFLKLYALSTNQSALKDVKRRIGAAILEVRLFQHDLGVLLKAQGKLFRAVFDYTFQASRAIVLLLPPAVLIMTQFVVRLGFEPVEPSSVVEVKAQLSADATAEEQKMVLVAEGSGVEVLGIPFPGDEDLQSVWKVRANRRGIWDLRLQSGDQSLTVPIAVGEAGSKLYNKISKHNFEEDLFWPGGPRIPDDHVVEYVEVDYELTEHVAGIFGNWFGLPAAVWYFGIVSLIAGLALKDKLGVEL